jgi:hypothetical protein
VSNIAAPFSKAQKLPPLFANAPRRAAPLHFTSRFCA